MANRFFLPILLLPLMLAACTSEVFVFGGGAGSGGDDAANAQGVGAGPVGVTSTGGEDLPSPTVTSGAGAAGGSANATSVTATSVTATSVTATSVTATSVTATSVTATSSSTGGGMMCAHDPCVTGASLAQNCDSCVTQICQYDAYCCAQNGQWDLICSYFVDALCGKTCPSDPNVAGCDALYGNATNYQLCYQSANSCEFAIQTQNSQSCGTVCSKGGGECVGLVNDVNNQPCTKPNNYIPNADQCNNTNFNSAVCICTRGCGGAPACTAGKTCNNGTCQ
jgi:hypothetical protein